MTDKHDRPVSGVRIRTVGVSAMRNVTSHELVTVSLFDELQLPNVFSTSNWIEQIESIREFRRKYLRNGAGTEEHRRYYAWMKRELPVILPAGEFSRRSDDAMLRPSGFMQFDIDAKDNKHRDLDEVKWRLAECKQVAYVGYSLSGEGLWGLVRIECPHDFHRQGKRLLQHLKHHTRAVYDEPVTLRKSGLRVLSYDDRAWVNPDAEPFRLLWRIEKPRMSFRRPPRSADREQMEELLERLESAQLDITSKREEWIKMLFAISTSFGADGVRYAQRLSQFYTGYNPAHVEKVFLGCDSRRHTEVPLSYVAKMAEKHLIR